MKNIFKTAGLAAVAVAGYCTTSTAQTVTVDDSKWWEVSASLRGFYDDNYTAAPSGAVVPLAGGGFAPAKRDSFGFEVRPGVTLAHQGEQHLLKLQTQYAARYFEDRDNEPWDHGLFADLLGEYKLSENHVVRLNDTFTWTQEPVLVDRGGVITAPLRGDGTNKKNSADLKYVGQFTPLVGLEVGYANVWYDYETDGAGSFSALLDRMEHTLRGETRWTISPSLAGILGYWYEIVDFDGGQPMVAGGNPALDSTKRNSRSHYLVTGADYTMSSHTFFSLRGGAQNVTYNEIAGEPDQWNPFADLSGTVEYAEGSYVRGGVRYGRNRTDALVTLALLGAPAGIVESDLTIDQESYTAYAVVSHKITEALTGRLSGQAQLGSFDNGVYNNTDENIYILGVSLTYDLTQNLALETGYNYDRVDSDTANRSYTRNRVFLGVRGQF